MFLITPQKYKNILYMQPKIEKVINKVINKEKWIYVGYIAILQARVLR